ncbi:MAG: GlsB/YeaQ/YmgE family stress response membrane protein [Chloroflexi bacterium]|nr:GlsB/YeaQ/YmgE family stress response membrane protein [Chloroflexota bacterium]
MGIVAWLVVGAIAGWLAGMVMKSSGGLITDIIVGILGALIGGFIFNALGSSTDVTGINLPSILVAFIGSCVLLAGLRFLKR